MNIRPAPRSQKPPAESERPKKERSFPQTSRLGCILTTVLTCVAIFFTGNLVASAFPSGVYGDNQWSNLGAMLARLGLAFAAVIIVVGGLLYLFFAKVLPPKDQKAKPDEQGK